MQQFNSKKCKTEVTKLRILVFYLTQNEDIYGCAPKLFIIPLQDPWRGYGSNGI